MINFERCPCCLGRRHGLRVPPPPTTFVLRGGMLFPPREFVWPSPNPLGRVR